MNQSKWLLYLFLEGNGKSSDGWNGHFLEGAFSSQGNNGDTGTADRLDDGRGVEMTSTVEDVTVDFDQLVSDLKTSVFESNAVRIETANKDGHDGTIFVSGQTQAEAHGRQTTSTRSGTVQIHADDISFQVAPSLLNFFCIEQC